ncbi:transcription termination factor NusA [Candidatus Arthromitus sp. SFB-rat-Yit]|uniref:transcription termination factor NusA n=1 Tax=Candidatus Arthromitus sp. SFB-rat-Yit TaxID=1041504 RepID=UPI000227A7E0|nr:transcription termination factor NusA [Candidatus Arthromitus sp. SFB-rat-Yit]BAK81173.1 transcription elongation factor NusA [Candidatus Arthromitus sp. SFB-rat-Yit]
MNKEFIDALKIIVKDKGISEDLIFTTIEDALIAAYKKNYANQGASQNVKVTMNRVTGEIKVFAQKLIVESIRYSSLEIILDDAQKISPYYNIGDICDVEVTPKSFGRVAATLAKQVVTQRIKEAERDLLYKEYVKKEFQIITGKVLRNDKDHVFINIGRIETILRTSDKIPKEKFMMNEKIKLYVSEVINSPKGTQVHVSRTDPNFVKKLFELEVSEIQEGIVEIKNIVREAGARTKMSVFSNMEEVDPVGACVGEQGLRVRNVVNELKNEKIDIIKWSEDPEVYISNALNPASIYKISLDSEKKLADVIVDDSQLSLAIGKEGQNVRLAAKLTGWKIDIKALSKVENSLHESNAKEEEIYGNNIVDVNEEIIQEEIVNEK